MRLDLTEIARTIGARASQDVNEKCPDDLGLDCVSNVTGKLDFSNTGSLLLIKGQMKFEVKLECGRCLEDFVLPVNLEIEEEFEIERIGDGIKILPLEDEEEPKLIVNNHLDIQELVRQNLLLELPIQPICRPDCMGLCPACGENLNMRKCVCPPAESESPFKALADLIEKENNESKE